jgi:hypothetical protein
LLLYVRCRPGGPNRFRAHLHGMESAPLRLMTGQSFALRQAHSSEVASDKPAAHAARPVQGHLRRRGEEGTGCDAAGQLHPDAGGAGGVITESWIAHKTHKDSQMADQLANPFHPTAGATLPDLIGRGGELDEFAYGLRIGTSPTRRPGSASGSGSTGSSRAIPSKGRSSGRSSSLPAPTPWRKPSRY